MWTATGSLRAWASSITARHAGSGILRDVPRLSSTRILIRSGFIVGDLVGHRARRLRGIAGDHRTRHEQPCAIGGRLVAQREPGLLIVAEAEHGGDAVLRVGLQLPRQVPSADARRRIGAQPYRVARRGRARSPTRAAASCPSRRFALRRPAPASTAGPTAVILLPVMTTVPFSITLPVPSMTRPPTKAVVWACAPAAVSRNIDRIPIMRMPRSLTQLPLAMSERESCRT